jgi:hypothetical protein
MYDIEKRIASGGWFHNYYDFPIILQPHESKLIDLKLSLKDINSNLTKFYLVSGDTAYQTFCKIEFAALDSKARKHRVSTGYQINLNTTDKMVSLCFDSTGNGNEFTPTQIFLK